MPDPAPMPVSTDVGSGAAPAAAAPPSSDAPPPATDAASVGQATGAAQQAPTAAPIPPLGDQFDNDFRAAYKSGDAGRLSAMMHGAVMALLSGRGLVGAGMGAVTGAIAPNDVNTVYQQQKQMRQGKVDEEAANVRFANSRAAEEAIHAMNDSYNYLSLPDPLQAQHDALAQQQIKALTSVGQKPIVAQDEPGAGEAILKQLARQSPDGKVPLSAVIRTGGLLYVFPTFGTGTPDYDVYAQATKESGVVPVSRDVFSKMKPDQQSELLHNAQSFFTTVPDADHIDQTIAATKSARATYDQNAPFNPGKAGVLKKYDDRLNFLQQTSNFYDARNRQYLAQKEAVKQRAAEAEQGKPSLLGDSTDLDPKQYGIVLRQFKTNRDALAKTEENYSMFVQAARDARRALNGGPDISGAESVVSLFNAIGLSATPLKGMGFRINNNTIQEHVGARSLGQGLYQKLLSLKAGDVITPQQILDYSKIAGQARLNAYQSAFSEAQNAGLKRDNFLPHGYGKQLDPNTQQIFLSAADNDSAKAARAAKAFGWRF
jgi:hypothetical protein